MVKAGTTKADTNAVPYRHRRWRSTRMTAIMPHAPARTEPTLPGWLPLPDEKPGPTFDLCDVWDGTFDPENPPGPTFDI